MAIMKGGLLSGRVGNQLYYVRNGKQLVRSVFKKSKSKGKPSTEAQLKQLTKIDMVMKFLVPLKSIVYYTCRPRNNSMTGMNRAVQQVFREAFYEHENGLYINPAKVKVSMGGPSGVAIENVQMEGGTLRLQWMNGLWSPYQQAFVLVYNIGEELVQLSDGNLLRDQHLEMQLQDEIRKGTLHLYFYLSDRLGKSFSESSYLGEF